MTHRYLILIILAFGITSIGHADNTEITTITSPEVEQVFSAIIENDWGLVEKLTLPLINRDSPAQRHLIARLRYIYLISLAREIEKNRITHSDLKPKLALIENKLIIQPWHPIKNNASPCFNLICQDPEKQDRLFTIQSNNDATQIYSFEYFTMSNKIDISSYNGQNARLGGRLSSIEINHNFQIAQKDNKKATWFFRLSITDGFIEYER